MSYCSTPKAATGASPAQLMTGRHLSTTIPVLKKTLMPNPVNPDLVYLKNAKAKDSYRFFYNHRYSACPLPKLRSGSVRVKLVLEKGWTGPAKVVSKSKELRSYHIEMANWSVAQRNRHHQEVPATDTSAAQHIVDPAVSQQDADPQLQRWPFHLNHHQTSQ